MNEDTNNEELSETVRIISNQFDIHEDEFLPQINSSKNSIILDGLVKILSEKIKFLMANNFEKLSNILYRIDVNPSKVDEAFSTHKLSDIPDELSKLIIQRQIAKVKTRNHYRTKKLES